MPDFHDRSLTIVRYGTRPTRKSECYYNYALYHEPDAPVVMDYFFWIYRDAGQVIVIDSGFSHAAAVARKRSPLIAPADALARLGIDPAEVKQLILTHAHYDHAGNLGLYPNAQVIMFRREYDFWRSPLGQQPQYLHHADPRDLDYLASLAEAGRVTLLDGPEHTLMPGFELFELGGHTPGQMALRIQLAEGPLILASDAVHYYEELELDRPFAVIDSLAAMYHGYARIRDWLQAPGAVMVPGHDPDVMNRFPPVDPAAPEFAVRAGAAA
ncbi:MBL fold metallo-hydrolase [Pseudomonas sp. NPDC007930]|uniref:N-acyl homoserine lactonase family protein n=1 Tax=Pseudomonas sp. NPDC007930 TaxID=3364417 RepID=UPI0036EA52A3